MKKVEAMDFAHADEVRPFPHGHVELLNMGEGTVGRLHVVMQDGHRFDMEPGTVFCLPSGHDAWVVGDEPVVLVDWYGASHYAEG